MGTVFANKREIIHKGDGYTETCPVPDVCKTPSPGGPVPIPYINVAMDSDLADGTKTVKIEGNMVAHQSANLSTSTGDEGGTAGGGIVSSKIKGKHTWPVYSTDVKFEGEGVIRFMETCLHNGNSSNTGSQPHLGGFAGCYPNVDENEPCPRCKKPVRTHKIPNIPQNRTSIRGAKKLLNRMNKLLPAPRQGQMVGVLVAQCGSKVKVFAAMAGTAGSIPSGFAAAARAAGAQAATTAVNTAGHTRTNPRAPPEGNCAAPKLLAQAKQEGCRPLAMTEAWYGPSNPTRTENHRQESCETCKENLPRMLCSNDEKKPAAGSGGGGAAGGGT